MPSQVICQPKFTTKAASTKHPVVPQLIRAMVSVVLWFALVREMRIWIDFDSLPSTNIGTIEREGDPDAETVFLFKNPL